MKKSQEQVFAHVTGNLMYNPPETITDTSLENASHMYTSHGGKHFTITAFVSKFLMSSFKDIP